MTVMQMQVDAFQKIMDARHYAAQVHEITATLLCDDGVSRQFLFRYYENNGMWRLNVPNDTPEADWARQNKDGIAVVEIGGDGQPVKFRIIRPGAELNDVADRSIGLGTWGRTTTRLYGWY
jgi:hypothetical protein